MIFGAQWSYTMVYDVYLKVSSLTLTRYEIRQKEAKTWYALISIDLIAYRMVHHIL